ncbi:MAG: hypothetical protein J6D52_11305 [Clostridia bacterium]|nr:hypothetical protein [Clostridia bacterium]
MKKITLILLMIALLMITGCKDDKQKNLYLPEAKNDKVYTTIGGEDETHQGVGYTLTIPTKNYRYEKDYDDGNLEEKWDYTKKDDVEIKVTTYKNTDEITARSEFLRDNEDYIFEDLTGYSLCGQELDGDTLWFNLYESNGTIYIVSWEFPKNTKEDLKKELDNIAGTFTLTE